MAGGKIVKCENCERLVIYGQTCVCGHDNHVIRNGRG